MNWPETIQILLTGVAAIGSLLCLAVLLGMGRRLERGFAGADGSEFDERAALESIQRWDDHPQHADDRSD